MDDRRRWLKVVAGAAGGATAAAVVMPPAALTVASAGAPPLPGRHGGDEGWRFVARWDELAVGAPLQAHVIGAEVDGWSVSPDRRLGAVWLLRGGEGTDTLRVLSAICPHLGCLIEHRAGAFVCPCHNSDFDPVGAAVRGPSPRAMDPLESRVRDGRVEVRWVRFRLGSSERVREEG